jgi:hypothetical protein
MSATIGDDPFGVGPAGEPRRPERAVGNAVPVIVALVAWVVVGAIELVDVPNVSVGVPVVEAAVWAAAVVGTVYVVWRVRRAGVLAALIGGAAFAYFTNWSVFEARSYDEFHRWGLGHVAATPSPARSCWSWRGPDTICRDRCGMTSCRP